ncbi:MAG: SDR family NAD(P)-dependent oxidoreductase [Bdellovibrionales bacterium]|nr:SDR family NAD(P)-dependent oxidoreductase [Bdellovibrionales bacterium]
MSSKTIIITGASAGIGRAIGEMLVQDDHHLYLLARRTDKIEAWIDQIPPSKIKATVEIHQIDVSRQEDVDSFFDQLVSEGASINVLINNAGFAAGKDPVKLATMQDWQSMMQTNFFGAFWVAKRTLPLMPKHAGSRIINVGSIAGLQGYPGGGGYCASKFALKAFSQTLRLELLEDGIGVTSIEPGLVETEFSMVRLGDEQKAKDVYQGMKPLTAKDIASMIYFVTNLPEHVNVESLVTMPMAQASVFHVQRK